MKSAFLTLVISACALAQSVTISAPVFSGSGLNDAHSGGVFSLLPTNASYTATISATGTPDHFKWSKNGGTLSAAIAIAGGACALPAVAGSRGWQALTDGVLVCWLASTGHTLAASWAISASGHGSLRGVNALQQGIGAVPVSAEDKVNDRASCAPDFGIVADGTDQAAKLTACLSSPHKKIYWGPDLQGRTAYYTASKITISGSAALTDLEVSPDISIECPAGVIPCIDVVGIDPTLTGSKSAHIELPRIVRSSIDWHPGGTDTTSVGLRIANVFHSIITPRAISGFHTGILLCGGNGVSGDPCEVPTPATTYGAYNNIIFLPTLQENMIGIDIAGGSGGFNQDELIGGEANISSVNCQSLAPNIPYPGTVYLKFEPGDNNGLKFDGFNAEGGCAAQKVSGEMLGSQMFNPRFEDDPAHEIGTSDVTGVSIYDPYISSGTYHMFQSTVADTISVPAGDGLHVVRTSGADFISLGLANGSPVVLNGFQHAVNAVADGDHLTVFARACSPGPTCAIAGAPLSSAPMLMPLSPGRLGNSVFGPLGWYADTREFNAQFMHIYDSYFPLGAVDIAAGGTAVTANAGVSFAGHVVGETVYVGYIPNSIATYTDSTHITLTNAVAGAPLTGVTLQVPTDVFSVSSRGVVFAQGLTVAGTISAASFDGLRIGPGAPDLGDIAGALTITSQSSAQWVNSTAYVADDTAFDSGIYYRAIASGTNKPPASNLGTFWEVDPIQLRLLYQSSFTGAKFGVLDTSPGGGFVLGNLGGHLRMDSLGTTGYEFRFLNTANSLAGITVGGVSSTGAGTFSALDIGGAPVATQAWVNGQGFLAGLTVNTSTATFCTGAPVCAPASITYVSSVTSP